MLFVAVRATLFTAEPIVILGLEAIFSLNVAVTVMLSPGLILLSLSLVDNVTVGVELSLITLIVKSPYPLGRPATFELELVSTNPP